MIQKLKDKLVQIGVAIIGLAVGILYVLFRIEKKKNEELEISLKKADDELELDPIKDDIEDLKEQEKTIEEMRRNLNDGSESSNSEE